MATGILSSSFESMKIVQISSNNIISNDNEIVNKILVNPDKFGDSLMNSIHNQWFINLCNNEIPKEVRMCYNWDIVIIYRNTSNNGKVV